MKDCLYSLRSHHWKLSRDLINPRPLPLPNQSHIAVCQDPASREIWRSMVRHSMQQLGLHATRLRFAFQEWKVEINKGPIIIVFPSFVCLRETSSILLFLLEKYCRIRGMFPVWSACPTKKEIMDYCCGINLWVLYGYWVALGLFIFFQGSEKLGCLYFPRAIIIEGRHSKLFTITLSHHLNKKQIRMSIWKLTFWNKRCNDVFPPRMVCRQILLCCASKVAMFEDLNGLSLLLRVFS